MTRADQRELLTNFCNQMRDAMLDRSARWPDDWDGHELRELAAYAFDHERTRLMRVSAHTSGLLPSAVAWERAMNQRSLPLALALRYALHTMPMHGDGCTYHKSLYCTCWRSRARAALAKAIVDNLY